MGTTTFMIHWSKPQHLAAGLMVLALAAASGVPARAQAQIGGALPSLSIPPTLTPMSPVSPTLISPLTAPPLTSTAPAPQAAAPAPAAAPAQPAQR